MKESPVIWLTGLPCSGKTTLALALGEYLRDRGLPVEILDGDEFRRSLSADLGFTPENRREQARRVTYVSKLLTRNGIITIVPLISPYRDSRSFARRELGRFIEVYVQCPLDECIRRDTKGLYTKALKGEIKNFTGVSDPYEEPEHPDVTVHTDSSSVGECVGQILRATLDLGYLGASPSDDGGVTTHADSSGGITAGTPQPPGLTE